MHIDISEKAFKQALRDFKMSIQGGDEVLVFFAGHGVQLGATNYLLPTDIKGDNEEQVKDEAIQLQRILDDMQERTVRPQESSRRASVSSVRIADSLKGERVLTVSDGIFRVGTRFLDST